MTQFRSATGQTGRDAYIYEAAQIENAQRALNERFARLLTAAHDEHPELFESISDYCAQLDGVATNAESFGHYLRAPGRLNRR